MQNQRFSIHSLTGFGISSMFGGLTHYGCGPAPVYFGAGYIDVKVWWKVGAACALVNFIIWGGIGSLWMKLIGFW